MKVFISWSGDVSRQLAETFRKWLPSVLQAVKPYFTPDDISKGSRWSSEISNELDNSKVGVIFLTKDNLQSLWVMFEAGALSKNIDTSKVVPILFEIEPSDIVGPLVQFQAAKFNKAEIRKVVNMINKELGEIALQSDVLDEVFDMWFPKLESDVKGILASIPSPHKGDIRSDRDLIEEILEISRRNNLHSLKKGDLGINPRVIQDLIKYYRELVEFAKMEDNKQLQHIVRHLFRPIEYIAEKTNKFNSRGQSEKYDILLMESKDELQLLYKSLKDYDTFKASRNDPEETEEGL